MVVKLREGGFVDCGRPVLAVVVRVCRSTEAVTLLVGDGGQLVMVPRDEIQGGRCRLQLSHQGLFQVGVRPRRRREPPGGASN